MEVLYHNRQSLISISEQDLAALVAAFLHFKNISTDEVHIHFVGPEEITELHDEFFNDPTITDCISFPIDSPDSPAASEGEKSILGEIFVCTKVALDYSQEHNLDPEEELTLYVVHGLLHLLGYDDIDEEDRKVMRREEAKAIKMLKEKTLILKIHSYRSDHI